jgi:Transglycosylase-like domain
MIRRLMLFASAAGALAVPGTAHADSLTQQTNHLRAEVVAEFGKRAPGRNIVRWGALERDGRSRPADRAELLAYRDNLAQMLAPPPRPMGTPASASTVAASPESTSSGSSSSTSEGASSGSLPACTWQPESGGDWSAVNSSSGAGGYYQIIPSTWAAYGGTGSPQSASPAEQTAIAQKIWASQGSSAWTNC